MLHPKQVRRLVIGDDYFLGEISYENIINEFVKNPLAYRCVAFISSAIGLLGLDYQNKQLKILPGVLHGWQFFWESIVFSLQITGNAFVFLEKKDNEFMFHLLETQKISLLFTEKRLFAYEYQYDMFSVEKTREELYYLAPYINNNKIIIPKENIIHIELSSSLLFSKTFSPTSTAFNEIKKYNYLNNLILEFAKNGGRVSGIFSYDDFQSPHDEDLFKDEVYNLYNKMKKTSAIMVLKGGSSWQNIGMSPKEMDFSSRILESLQSICNAYGVPPILLGVSNTTGYNYKEARMFFWQDTIKPLGKIITETINCHFKFFFDLNPDFSFSNYELNSKSGRREDLLTVLEGVSFLSRDEKRRFFGL